MLSRFFVVVIFEQFIYTVDLQLENGAKLWQQSMNASSMARWDINNESGEKTLENAHSEPLKSIIPKDVVCFINIIFRLYLDHH